MSKQELLNDLLETLNTRAMMHKSITKNLRVLTLVNDGLPLLIAVCTAEKESKYRKRQRKIERDTMALKKKYPHLKHYQAIIIC
jgi:hypothetical protein